MSPGVRADLVTIVIDGLNTGNAFVSIDAAVYVKGTSKRTVAKKWIRKEHTVVAIEEEGPFSTDIGQSLRDVLEHIVGCKSSSKVKSTTTSISYQNIVIWTLEKTIEIVKKRFGTLQEGSYIVKGKSSGSGYGAFSDNLGKTARVDCEAVGIEGRSLYKNYRRDGGDKGRYYEEHFLCRQNFKGVSDSVWT